MSTNTRYYVEESIKGMWLIMDKDSKGSSLLGCNNPVGDKEATERLCHAANMAFNSGFSKGATTLGDLIKGTISVFSALEGGGMSTKSKNNWVPGIVDNPDFKRTCNHPEHEPPKMILIPPGKMLNHECPACGERRTIRPLPVTF